MAADEDAFSTGHAYVTPFLAKKVGYQPRGGGFAVHSGYANQGNAAGLLPREEMLQYCFSNWPRGMQHQIGAGRDVRHIPPLFFQRPANIFRANIHGGDIQPHDKGGVNCTGSEIGMHAKGHFFSCAFRLRINRKTGPNRGDNPISQD